VPQFCSGQSGGPCPDTRSTIIVFRPVGPRHRGKAAGQRYVGTIETDVSAEGLAISPDGRLVATMNMRGTVLLPASSRYEREASVSLLTLDPATGVLAKVADYPFEGELPECGAFDLTGDHFWATVFQDMTAQVERLARA